MFFTNKEKKKYNRDRSKNIFKGVRDRECEYINKRCKDSCFCVKDEGGNIFKFFIDGESFKRETDTYLQLIDTNLIPMASPGERGKQLTYFTNGLISLRNLLILEDKTKQLSYSYIFNELFSFVNRFRQYNFVHGNLHIDNIFVKTEGNSNKLVFYVIDTSQSFIVDYNTLSKFQKYIDFIKLYVSLLDFFKEDCITDTITKIVAGYIYKQ